jgi:hypothetical protein
MNHPLEEDHLSRLLRNGRPTDVGHGDLDKVWFKIEDRLRGRKKHFWNLLVWKPKAHPGSWAAMAACLCLVLMGFQYQRHQADTQDLASYLITISEPTVNLTSEADGFNVTSLLDDNPTPASDVFLSDEPPSTIQPTLYQ